MAKCLLWQGAPRQAKQTPVKMSFKQNLQNIPTPVRGVEESCSPVKSNLEGIFRAPQQHCTITSPSVATCTGPTLLKAPHYKVCLIKGSSVTPAGYGLGWITWWRFPTLSIAKAGCRNALPRAFFLSLLLFQEHLHRGNKNRRIQSPALPFRNFSSYCIKSGKISAFISTTEGA